MEPELPYWKTLPNVAPIKAEFILWEKVNSRTTTAAVDLDDAAEGRSSDKPTVSRNEEDRLAKLENSNIASTSTLASTSVTSDHPPPSPETGERNSKKPRLDSSVEASIEIAEVTVVQPEKKVRLSGGQKKKLKRAEQDRIWNEKRAEKEKIKAEGGTVKKEKGQNKGRKFEKRAGEQEIKLCSSIAKGKVCARVDSGCRWDHDLISYLAGRPLDVPIVLPISDNDLSTTLSTTRMCPSFETLGECSQGFKCRFGLSHMKQVTAGEGFAGSDWILIINEEKVAKVAADKGEGLSEIRERGEMNVISIDRIKIVRGQGIDKDQRFPLSVAYLNSIGEPIDLREGKDGKKKKDPVKKSTVYVVNESDDDQELPAPPIASTSSLPPPPVEIDIDSQPSRNFIPDMAPIRAGEKKTLDFRNKLYLAPLTTVGNLPFRRLCGDFGNDISCSEMGLSQEFLNGNASEWSLVRRHPSEKVFGVQICGSRPQALVPAAEAIVKSCDIDFLDVNCGCPIDLVFNKGAGSALLQHATRLGKSLVGMSQVLGEIPLTIKIRTGVNNSSPVAHKLVTRMQTEWGISAVTLHGRSRQQRYKTKADYAYIAQCAKTLREAAEDQGLKPIPIFGNGDAYDYRTYYENMESSGVDGIMIARGALVKPWIFTEIKEKRDWDISSRERLDMLGQLVNYGMDHWGSDQIGLNTTRRFFCEALSFQHRYIPVGLLEHLPAQLNDRPYPYKGRNELESLLASDQSSDWVKISEMFLGPAPEDWNFAPKHKSNANGTTDDVKISAEG